MVLGNIGEIITHFNDIVKENNNFNSAQYGISAWVILLQKKYLRVLRNDILKFQLVISEFQ